jgi:hypothetical protein
MQKRTEAEIEAYVDGYNACYEQCIRYLNKYCDTNNIITKLNLLHTAVNAVVEKEGDGCCEPKGY